MSQFELPPQDSTEMKLLLKMQEGVSEGFHLNTNPVAAETYRRLFKKLVYPGDIVVNLGTGVAIDVSGNLNYLNKEIVDACEEKGARLIAIDLGHTNLVTHNYLKEVTGNTSLHPVEADAMQLPLAAESVRGIVSSNLINCPNPEFSITEQGKKIIDEAWRVLRPGGFLLLSSFGYKIISKDVSGKIIYNNDLREDDILTLKDIEVILSKQGFIDIAELDVDDEVQKQALKYVMKREYVEEGGFIAYKPKKK